MKITFYGQNSLHIETAGKKIIVDPFISGNPLSKDKVNIKDLEADYILVTHAHEDHTLDVEAIATNTGAKVVSSFEIANHYGAKGIDVHPMAFGGKWAFDFGTVKYIQAAHTSSFPDGSYGGQPGGFIVESDGKCIYIAGDTALMMDMKLIPMQYTLDLAILPIGDNFTMGAEDAVIASDFIECNRILGVHYDTFGYIEIDHDHAKKTFADSDKELILLPIGDSITV